MRRFFERCEAQWTRQPGASYWMKHYRNQSQADLFPTAVCAELRQLLDDALRRAADEKIHARVAFVAKSFGVTERFVRLNEARARLSRDVVAGVLAGRDGQEKLKDYLDARREFLRYSKDLTDREPLAFYRIGYEDFLRDNPAFAAAAALVAAGMGEPASGAEPEGRAENGVSEARSFARALIEGTTQELLLDGSLEGPRTVKRKIAGLTFAFDLPGAWQSSVEPTQRHVGEVTKAAARSGEAGLHLSGAINTTVLQWRPAVAGRLYVGSVHTRGHVTSSDAVFLSMGWLDAQGKHLGVSLAARLPDGAWPEWVQLQQGARAPDGAAWVGIGVHLQNQMPGDWVEFDDFSLLDAGGKR